MAVFFLLISASVLCSFSGLNVERTPTALAAQLHLSAEDAQAGVGRSKLPTQINYQRHPESALFPASGGRNSTSNSGFSSSSLSRNQGKRKKQKADIDIQV